MDEYGQHVVPGPEVGTGIWAQFSQQNAAALEVVFTEACTHTHESHLSTWLSRDKALPPAEYPQHPSPCWVLYTSILRGGAAVADALGPPGPSTGMEVVPEHRPGIHIGKDTSSTTRCNVG